MYCYFEGKLLAQNEARIGINDLALIRGFGIFDYFIFYHSKPRFLEDYINRFYSSALLLGLKIPLSKENIKRIVFELIAKNELPHGGIRLLLTGGYSTNSYMPANENLIIYQYPLPLAPPIQYIEGASVATYLHQREIPTVKSINYLTGIRLISWLKEQQADYPLYHNGKNILESDRSNFFILTEENELLTAKDNVLKGITLEKVIFIAKRMGITVKKQEVSLQALKNAKEAYLTSSIKGVLPVTKIDGQLIGDGKPSLLAKQLQTAYLELADNENLSSDLDLKHK